MNKAEVVAALQKAFRVLTPDEADHLMEWFDGDPNSDSLIMAMLSNRAVQQVTNKEE